MGEKIPSFVEMGSVSAENVRQALDDFRSSIIAAILKYEDSPDFRPQEAGRLIETIKEKTTLFSSGLMPDADYRPLYDMIDRYQKFAPSLSYEPQKLLSTQEIIERALDAIQGNMVVNGLITQEAKEELLERWPIPERSID